MALAAEDGEELVALAEERGLVLMPGHLLLYHPGVAQAEGACRLRRARRGPLRLREPPEPRHDPARRERALEPGRARPLGHPPPPRRGADASSRARGESFLKPEGIEDVVFCYLRFPSGKTAHMHLSWLDPHKMRRMTVVGKEQDGRLRRHGARPQGDRLRQRRRAVAPHVTASGARASATSTARASPNAEPLRLECEHFLGLAPRRGRPARGRAQPGSPSCAALEQLQASLERERV